MAEKKSYTVLKDCRFLLRLLKLSNEGVDQTKSPTFGKTVQSAWFYFLWFLPLNTMFVLVWLLCADVNFNLIKMIWPVNLIVMGIQIESIFFCMVAKKSVTTEAITKLQLLIDGRFNASTEAREIYERVESKNAKFCSIVANGSAFVVISVLIVNFMVFATHIILGVPEHCIPPIPMKTFLEEDDEFEFSAHFVIQGLGAIVVLVVLAAYSWCCIGLCIYLYAVVDDFEVVAARIKPTTNCNGKRVDAKVSDVEVARTLTELVELHINILSIMDSTQKLFSGPFFFQFFMFVMSIVLEIHSIETGLGHFTFESFVCFEVVLLQIGICYAICYVGTILTARAEEIADFVYDIDWFTLKITQQKTIINIMNQGQSPFVMSGWGFVSCTLETFATMMQSSYSYYTILRQFEN